MSSKTLLDNRYQILEKLGQGGMGDVYKGFDTLSENFVAIKHLRDTVSSDETIIERFRREGEALRNLNHPNIVKMLGMIQQEDEYYLITEYIEAGDLAAYLKSHQRFELRDGLKIALELADALSRAHHLGVIHRDIKPANVLLAADGSPRLTDFGIAHIESQERLTGTGIAMGTLDYLPPEAINGEAVDVRADIWSFGVMLYEMFTGQRPFQGTTSLQVLQNIITMDIIPIHDLVPDIPIKLSELIGQMLEKDREIRIHSIRHVGASIEAILHGRSQGAMRFQTPSQSRNITTSLADNPTVTPLDATIPLTKTRRNPMFGLGVFVIAIVLLGVGVFFANEGALFSTAASPTPEATATDLPILEDVPVGYSWRELGEIRFLAPSSWVLLPQETFIQMGGALANDAEMNYALEYFASLRTFEIYADITSLFGVAASIEDTSVFLPDEVLIERTRLFAQNTGGILDDEPTVVNLPIGHTIRTVILYASANNDAADTLMESYWMSQGGTLYGIQFAGRASNFEQQREQINTILSSYAFTTNLPEITPEATAIVIEDVPDDWKTVQGETMAYAVPRNFIVTTDTNSPLIESSTEFFLGTGGDLDATISLIDQVNLETFSGSFTDSLFFVATARQESQFEIDIETATNLVMGTFSTVENDNVQIEITDPEMRVLAAGEAQRFEMNITFAERPPLRNVSYLLINDEGNAIYLISFSMLDSDYESLMPLIEQIVQTLRILPYDSE